jgi:hypothetical protein
VLSLEVPPFDLLTGQSSPFEGFGEPLLGSAGMHQTLLKAAEGARQRLEEGFNRKLETNSLPTEIDNIVEEMWVQDWDPQTGNVNLFATDFGLVLTVAILSTCRGEPVFRSERDVSHLSIWWRAQELEAFPFHRMLKRLWNRDGESVTYFVRALSQMVG